MSSLSADYGDGAVLDPDDVLPRFHRWLHKLATVYVGQGSADYQDLVQEGRIAMWRALGTYTPSKGALASYVTQAAEWRMREFAVRRGFFGQATKRGSKRSDRFFDTDSIERRAEDGVPLGSAEADLLNAAAVDAAIWAYHRGEIHRALDTLSPMQKRYVIARFWCGVGGPELCTVMKTQSPHVYWTAKKRGARDRLREALIHLEAA